MKEIILSAVETVTLKEAVESPWEIIVAINKKDTLVLRNVGREFRGLNDLHCSVSCAKHNLYVWTSFTHKDALNIVPSAACKAWRTKESAIKLASYFGYKVYLADEREVAARVYGFDK